MNLFKDISPQFSERIRSPLYGSFIISWFVCNWKIILAVTFFRKEDLHGENVVDFISHNYLNVYTALVYPLSISLSYLLIMPWIDYLIIWYTEIAKRTKIDKKIEVGRMHKVEGNLYYDLRFKFEEERKKVLDIEADLVSYKGQIEEKDNKLKEANGILDKTRTDFTSLNNKYSDLSNRHDIEKVLKGRWTVEYSKGKGQGIDIEHINVVGYEYKIIRNNSEDIDSTLTLIDVDLENKRLSFVKFRKNSPSSIVQLNVLSNDRFEGFENTVIPVTYNRTQFILDDIKKTNTRDYTKYIYNNETYPKNRLVHAIIKDYVSKNPELTYTKLEEAFPQSLQGHETFTTEEKARKKGTKKNFVSDDEIIVLSDSRVAVSSQWWNENILTFIEHSKKMGIEVSPEP